MEQFHGVNAVSVPMQCFFPESIPHSIIQAGSTHFIASELGAAVVVISCSVMVFIITAVTFSIVIICLYKDKSRLERKSKQEKDSSAIYDEICQLPLPVLPALKTGDNVAYASCHHFLRSATCTQ